MDKPTATPAHAAPNPSSDNYMSNNPPPAYPPNEGHSQPHVQSQSQTYLPQQQQQQQPAHPESHEMPKYGGSPAPDANYGGYYPPTGQPQPQQSFAGGPQNFQPYGTPLPALGPHPAPVECPECHARGVTAVEYSSGGFTHALAALVCFVSCLGCIPYFFSSLKDARHKCAKCGIPLATYHRSGRTEVHWHAAYGS
ncbi:Lipopolysaccharide-induced tumor necrosis factor-alpha factor-like protein [Colletotrichum orbiculare MAFF 240422]|uniref:Lipopolysaccharide-induced tumor necrosis factor-alpha factor-like protein n=1 Tax=Colletotrichum orbiculare (strain 104-T / ATCC 96160 / CBS 514.97 / LARS 414 / MAFF 240422) TaxID=1213857 RepID=N4VRJ3_COLOR|nr:Lipopolysaccharide-induced tumor necrosis factor-alpha factor-like protein [Colletotrichum orbiculare MAFF 240422]